jgi:hypothetical protein
MFVFGAEYYANGVSAFSPGLTRSAGTTLGIRFRLLVYAEGVTSIACGADFNSYRIDSLY